MSKGTEFDSRQRGEGISIRIELQCRVLHRFLVC